MRSSVADRVTRPAWALCAVLAVFSIAMLTVRPVSLEELTGGLIIVWLSAVPSILYFQGIDRAPVPFLPAVGAYYLIFYGLPIFAAPLAYLKDGHVVLHERVVLGPLEWQIMGMVICGLIAMFGAFAVARFRIFDGIPRFRISTPQRATALNASYWLLLSASLVYRLIPQASTIPSIGQFLGPAGFLALGGFFLQWRAGSLPRWQGLLLLCIFVPLDLYERMRFLFITDVVYLGAFFLFVLWRCAFYRTIGAIVTVGIVLAFTYSATTAFRTGGTTFSEKLSVTWDKATLDLTPITRTTVHVGEVTFFPALSPLINRIGHVWTLQTVYERSPDPVPYWGGETYKPLLTAPIPRLLYPQKPEERAGAAFGIRYGFGEADNNQTSFNVPWIVELLANFGPLGVLAGMAVFGGLLALLDKVFNARGMSDLEFLIGLTVIFRLFYQESNFSVMTGSIPTLILVLYVYFRIVPWGLERWILPVARDAAA